MNNAQSSIREAPTHFGGLLRNIGPGVVVSGSVVGSGELLVTTRMGAEVGFVFLWGVILACLVKFVIQLELGRQCLLRKSSTVQILDQVPGARWRGTSWIAWLCVVGYFSVTVAVIGILGSVAGLMVTVFPFASEQVWAVVIFLAMSVLLWRGTIRRLGENGLCAGGDLQLGRHRLGTRTARDGLRNQQRANRLGLPLCHASRRRVCGRWR